MENIALINYDIATLNNQLNFLNSRIDMNLYKRCSKCFNYKLKETDFHKMRKGIKSVCKSCCSAYAKEHYKNKKANKTN